MPVPEVIGKKPKHSLPHLGILYLASYLRARGVSVKILDWAANPIAVEKVVSKIEVEHPNLVGISSTTISIQNAISLIQALRKKLEDTPICLGGAHINGTKGELYDFYKDIDFLVYGEGEETLFELVKSLEKKQWQDIRGLIYKNSHGETVINPPRPFINDLDSLPFPDLGMIDIRQYSIFTGIKKPVASLMTSRGCPYQCSFCDVYNIMGRKLRLRSYQNVVDEIQNMVQNYGIKEIFIKDSTFTINKKWVMNFCNELLARKIDISYLCNTRVDCIDEPLIKKMKETGCRQISLGIESANEEILKNIKKNITISQVRKAFQLLNKYRIQAQAFFMIGNPGETEKTVRETIDLAKELCPDYAVFSVTMLFPNTDLYKWAVAKGCIQDRYWYMHTSPSYIFVSFARGQLALKDLPIERQAKLQKKAYREYYLRPRYILHRLAQLRSIEDFQHSLRAGWSIIKG